jgi:hypothetical protein
MMRGSGRCERMESGPLPGEALVMRGGTVTPQSVQNAANAAMDELLLDFNHLDRRGRVRIGPAATARIPALREGRLQPGTAVVVVDDDGNRCQGILREDPDQPPGHRLVVELDFGTWVDGVDGEEHAPPARDLAATG